MVKNKALQHRSTGIIFFLVFLISPYLGLTQEVDTLKLLHHWNDTSLEGSAQYDNTYNEVWGFIQNGQEYAVLGSTAGMHIFPLDKDPFPAQPYFVPGSSQGDHVIHRDFHDYQGYLYAVCDEGSSSKLQIIDIRNVEDSLPVVYESDNLFSRCHNIFIDSARARLYACSQKGGENINYSPLGIYDISDPTRPQLINTYSGFGNESIGHVHDAFVYNDTAYLNCGYDGLRIVDFSDPFNPQLLASLTDYPFRGYNHSGWVSDDNAYYYMGDETHGTDIKVLDITDIQELEVVNTFNAESTSEFSIPHNQLVYCDYLYVPYYFDGLQVFDITDPEEPVRSYVYQTSSESHIRNYKGAWGVYPFFPSGRVLVSDMQEGLFILEGPECEIETKSHHPSSLLFSVYPNPSSGLIRVDLKQHTKDVQIQIFDMRGSLILQREFGNTDKISLQNSLPAGGYIIRANAGSQYGQELLIISH